MKTSKNPNHPKKNSSIKVEPIRDRSAIKRIKKLLADQPRNLALFTLGINVAFRANELVALNVADVAHLPVGGVLDHKQKKTKKYRAVVINQSAHTALHQWLAVRPPQTPLPSFRANAVNGLRCRLFICW